MGKYGKFRFKQVKERRWKVHPIWRGIGCVFIILIPIISITAARFIAEGNASNNQLGAPIELQGFVDWTKFTNSATPVLKILPGLKGAVDWITNLKIYRLEVLLIVTFLIVGFGILTVAYSLMYSRVGPPRYGPVDSPPIRRSPRKGVGRSR